MKILIYGLHFKPDLIGIGKYTGEMTDWLSDHGHDIRVITAPHYYPEWKLKQRFLWHKKGHNPYLTWRCPIYVPSQPTGFTRLLHLLSFAVSSVPILIKNISWKPNFVISIEPPFFITPLTLLFSKLTKAKSILHIQDLEIDAAYSLNILKKGVLYNLIRNFEKFILNKFDIISTISSMMKIELIKKGVDKDKVHIFPNWADIDEITPKINNTYLKKQLSIHPSKIIILYSGNIGEKQNLENVINIAEKMQNNDKYIFLMVGDGASKSRLLEDVKRRNITNIIFLPLQPLKDLGALLTMADIHLVMQDKNIADYVLPSKFTSILSAGGVSIISAKQGTQLSQLVKKHEIGYLVEPDSESELYSAINYLLVNKSQHNAISTNARKYANKYLSRDKILSQFENNVLNN
ncbi:MAG: WcaI family glycosyltransferase [Candidatus Marinimicrobia bacterium]|nr:WcaI family glycosyltransferase [Candidatus Neomarinimicrobiota bacterium]